MIKPLRFILFTATWNMQIRSFLFRMLTSCCATIVLLLVASVAHAQIITETFEEVSGISSLTTGVTATTSSTGNTRTIAGIKVGTRAQNIPVAISTTTIAVTNYGSTNITRTSSSRGGGGNTRSYYSTSAYVTTGTRTTSTGTDGPDTTGNLIWYYGESTTMVISSGTTGFHSSNHYLLMGGGNGSFIITPTVSGGIASISFWAENTGTQANIYVGFRTNTNSMYPTFYNGNSSTTNTGGVYELFNARSSTFALSAGQTSKVYFLSSTSSSRTNGNTNSGSTSRSSSAISLHLSQYSFAVPSSLQGSDAQVVIANYGGAVDIDDIEVFGHIGISLGANPSTCYSASAQTVNLPFSTTSAGPTLYSISGWSSGFDDNNTLANVTNIALPSAPGTISITIPAGTAPGTYTASLTVTDGISISPAYSISVTVNGIYGIPTVPNYTGTNAISYYKLNNGTTDTTGAHNGTINGTSSYTTDRFNNATGAVQLDGSTYISTANSINDPTKFSESIWFKTTASSGTLIGFGDAQTGNSANYDRLLYLDLGHVVFGIYNSAQDTISSAGTYNDGNWHMATATESTSGGAGMNLYVDGVKVAGNTGYRTSQNFTGWWRIGEEDNWAGSAYFQGTLDDAVISSTTAFSAADVAALYAGLFPSDNSPICIGNTLNLYEPLSAPGYTYLWTGPSSNSFTATSENASIANVASTDIGTYSITVINAQGCSLSDNTTPTRSTLITPRVSVVPSGANTYYSFVSSSVADSFSYDAGTFHGTGSLTAESDRYGIANRADSFSSARSQYLSTAHSFTTSPPTVFTLSVWFKTATNSATEMPLIGMSNQQTTTNGTVNDRTLSIINGDVTFYTNPGSTKSISSPAGVSYADDNWHMATVTFSSANGTDLYVDGVLVASDNTLKTAATYASNSYWKIATTNINTTTYGYFKGSLDDIAIYNTTALTANQVSQLYSGTTSTNSANSVCEGTAITLSEGNVTVPGSTSTSYIWTTPSGSTYTGQTLPLTNPTNTNDSGTYTVLITCSPATGYCPATASINLAIDAAQIALSSGDGTDSQTVCNTATAISTITYAVTGTATGASITSWSPSNPGGISGSYSGGVFTISGTPATSGAYTYTVTTSGGSCTNVTAVGYINAGVGDTWTGATSSDWSDASNWSCGLPGPASDVYIPDVTGSGNPQPILSSNTSIHNISLYNNATLDLGGKILTINGQSSGPGTISTTATAALVMGGLSSGTISFTTDANTIDSLRLVDGATVTLGSPLNIASTGILRVGTITGTGATLVSNGELTLLSDDAGSAQVAPVPNDYGLGYTSSITGMVNVQCYIHSSNNSYVPGARRAWRLLTAPVTNAGSGTPTSIYAAWQNGGVYTPGVGTMITMPPSANYPGSGLDNGINGNYSAYNWSMSGQKLTPVNNTESTGLSNAAGASALDNIAYFIFVRGDRDPNTIADPSVATINNTTLNAPGILQLGTKTFSSGVPLGPNGLMMVGNPYASSVNFKLIAADTVASAGYTSGLTNLVNRFYFWNANLPGSSNVGGYVCVDDAANTKSYTENINDTTVGTGAANYSDLNIQSGQAFFVQSTGGVSSIAIKEITKTTATNFVFRPQDEGVATLPAVESFTATLALLNGNSVQAPCDGIVAQFNNNYSDTVDYLDAPKFGSYDESFSLARNGQQLCIERRADINAATKDTLFLNLTQTQQRSYQFKFNGGITNRPGVGVHLEDVYTGVHTPLSLNGTVPVNFTIDGNTASQVQNRFMVVFGAVNIVPAYTAITATQQGNTILVQWSLSNDQSMSSYALQRSTDGGVNYTTVYTTVANHTMGVYSWTDVSPVVGNNYYKVISTDTLGETSYSQVVSAAITSLEPAGITVYPNPIQGHQINISLNNMPVGTYYYKIYSILGHELQSGDFTNATTNSGYVTVQLEETLARGTYHLEIIHPDKVATGTDFVY